MGKYSMFNSSPYSIYHTFPVVSFKIVPVHIDCWIKFGEHIESILTVELWGTAILPKVQMLYSGQTWDMIKLFSPKLMLMVIFRSKKCIVLTKNISYYLYVEHHCEKTQLTLTIVPCFYLILMFAFEIFWIIYLDHHFSFLKFMYLLCLIGCILRTFLIIVLPYLNLFFQHVVNFLTSLSTKNLFIILGSLFPNVICNRLTIIDCLSV